MNKNSILIYPELDVILDRLSYDKNTGLFTRKTATGKIKKAGCYDKTGYVKIHLNGVNYLGHRLAWAIHYNEEPPEAIDHIDHNRHNNKIDNLRKCTHQENLCNQNLSKTSTSGYTGVSFRKDRGKYQAYINVKGKKYTLGSFIDIKDAIIARKEANIIYGFHENHGMDTV